MSNYLLREPVRAYAYAALTPIVALLVGYGWLTGEQAGLWVALATALLGVTGVEKARSVAFSPATVAAMGTPGND